MLLWIKLWNCIERNGKEDIIVDNINLTMTKPGDAAMQRTTYSQYYKENCAKGGVFL